MDYILESTIADHVKIALEQIASGIAAARCSRPGFSSILAPDGIEFTINVLVDGGENAVVTKAESSSDDRISTDVTPDVVSVSVRNAAESTTTRTDTHEKSVTTEQTLASLQNSVDNGVDTQVTDFEYLE